MTIQVTIIPSQMHLDGGSAAPTKKLERVDREENEILGKPRSQQSLSHQGEQNAEEDTKCEGESEMYMTVPGHVCHHQPYHCHRLPQTATDWLKCFCNYRNKC